MVTGRLSVKLSGFDNCCGAITIEKFYGTKKEIKEDLEEILARWGKVPLILCILNGAQNRIHKKTLLDNGFEIQTVARGFHKSRLYVYCRNIKKVT